MEKNNNLIAHILIVLVIASRFIPEIGLYTPVFAVLILTAMTFDKKYLYVPFVGILLSDFLLQYFSYYEFNYIFSSLFFLNYASYALVYFAIYRYNRKESLLSIGLNVILAPSLFFLLSNFVVWLTAGGVYPYTISGLLHCYEMGIPFYRQHIVSTMIFTPVLFAPSIIDSLVRYRYLQSK
tara:strand:- start:42 stop:584 length:543 start_codon:yes stop_codon:yes gene_type:complete